MNTWLKKADSHATVPEPSGFERKTAASLIDGLIDGTVERDQAVEVVAWLQASLRQMQCAAGPKPVAGK